jgi:hypothetical protein
MNFHYTGNLNTRLSKSKAVPVHATREYMMSRSAAPLILNLELSGQQLQGNNTSLLNHFSGLTPSKLCNEFWGCQLTATDTYGQVTASKMHQKT